MQIYEWLPEKKDWIKRFSTPRRIQLKDERPGALIVKGPIDRFEQILLLYADSGRIDLLVDNPTAQQHAVEGAPLWDSPTSLCKVLPGSSRNYELAWNNGRLWILACDRKFGDWGGSNFTLYAFVPGQRKAIEIPLRFDVAQSDKNPLKGVFSKPNYPGSIDKPHLASGGFFATDGGLIVTAYSVPGFWYIPYSDIPQIAPFISSAPAK